MLKKFIIAGVVAATATLGVAGIAYADTGAHHATPTKKSSSTSPSASTTAADDSSDASSDDSGDDNGDNGDDSGDDGGDTSDSAPSDSGGSLLGGL